MVTPVFEAVADVGISRGTLKVSFAILVYNTAINSFTTPVNM
jgi:hypothetical protein